jgi:hypothetical protein
MMLVPETSLPLLLPPLCEAGLLPPAAALLDPSGGAGEGEGLLTVLPPALEGEGLSTLLAGMGMGLSDTAVLELGLLSSPALVPVLPLPAALMLVLAVKLLLGALGLVVLSGSVVGPARRWHSKYGSAASSPDRQRLGMMTGSTSDWVCALAWVLDLLLARSSSAALGSTFPPAVAEGTPLSLC